MTDDQAWIGETMGGTVTRFERTAVGSSRGTWLVDVTKPSGEVLTLVLRRDTGDGPLSNTELSLQREAVVYRALAGTPVRIPRLRAVAPDGQALLVERAAGSADFAALSGGERAKVADDFLHALAELHAVDPAKLDLPGFARPASPEEHALLDLDLWERVYTGRVKRPSPLARFTFAWLRAHPPRHVERTVLCHGDVGPGNFMFEGGRVSAVLDWEFAHLGDPMDDVAWLTIRGHHLLGFGDQARDLARYSELSGLAVDPGRVRYYQAFVLLRMLVSCLVALDRRDGKMNVSTYFALIPVLERLLPPVLAAMAGVAAPPAVLPAPGDGGEVGEVADTVLNDLVRVVIPAVTDPAVTARAGGMAMLLAHVSTAQRLGPAIEAAELEDLATVLGKRPATVAEGAAALDAFVREHGAGEALIPYLSRRGERSLATWPAAASAVAQPLRAL